MAQKSVDKVGMLTKHLNMLDARMDTLYGESFDPKTEQAIKALLSEIRNYVRTLAQLEGELQGAPTVQLQQINVQFSTLKQLVLTKLCPSCRAMLLKALPEVGNPDKL